MTRCSSRRVVPGAGSAMQSSLMLIFFGATTAVVSPAYSTRNMFNTADRIVPWKQVGHETFGLYLRDSTSLRPDIPSMSTAAGAYLRECIEGEAKHSARPGRVGRASRQRLNASLAALEKGLVACSSKSESSSMAACGTLGRKSTSHARRKIIYWKLHKVGGSETCAIFSRYASERGLSFERDPDIRRNPKGRDHFDIICAHDVIRNPHWLELWANHPMTLHFVTFREPVSMAISRYYFQITHSEPSHPLYQYIPTIPEAREWFCVFLDRFLYTLEFAPRGYPGTPQLALQELQAAANASSATGLPGRLAVLLFERPTESYAYLQHVLSDLTLPARPAQPRRFVEHPTQRDWPAEALAEFRASADREGILELYSRAVARFEWQLRQLERSELCFLLKCNRQFYESSPEVQKAIEQAARGAAEQHRADEEEEEGRERGAARGDDEGPPRKAAAGAGGGWGRSGA